MQVVDTLVLFDGKIDTMQITMGDTAQIVLTLEHRLIDPEFVTFTPFFEQIWVPPS